MTYITVDTGYKGAMVLYDEFLQEPIDAFPFTETNSMMNIKDIKLKLDEWNPTKAFIEIFPPFPKQSIKTTAKQWRGIGQLDTLFQLKCIVEYVYAATWTSFTKRLSVNPLQESKKISQELAEKYHYDFIQPYKKRKLYHDGICDCLALGIYINRDLYLDEL